MKNTQKLKGPAGWLRRLVRGRWLRTLRWLQQQCQHPSDHVTADILDGDGETEIKWCRQCGAYKIHGGMDEWRSPRPDWCESPNVGWIGHGVWKWANVQAVAPATLDSASPNDIMAG